MVLAVLGLVTIGAWVTLDWPPPRLILKYGLPSAGGPTGKTEEFGGIRFIELSPGYFRMGSHHLCEKGDLLGLLGSMLGTEWGTVAEHRRTECPRGWVEIEEPFFFAVTEITNEQFENWVDHDRDKYSSEDDQPVGKVSWWAANRFCRRFSAVGGEEYQCRLPTEEEWEYACRAGTTTEYPFGDDPEDLATHAHYEAGDQAITWSSDQLPQAVGGRHANPWGLMDMLGNVWEWCSSAGPEGATRIIRGGGCRSGSDDCRSATRRWTVPGRRIAFLGFRPVMVKRPE